MAEAWKTITINLVSVNEWVNHYKTLLTENKPEHVQQKIGVQITTSNEVEPITVEEIKRILKHTKNGKAARPGNVPIELVKYVPDILLEIITKLFNKWLIDGQNIPEDWNMAHISSICKKGNKK